MRKLYYIVWNRLTVIFTLWAVALAWCAFFSNNVYMNAIIIYFGFMAAILGCAYVFESKNQTKGEKWLINVL